MPPDPKRSPRAAGGPAGAESEAGGGNRLGEIVAEATDTGTADAATPADHDAAGRQGMRRVTLGRSSSDRCHNCGRSFASLAGAVSHGRSVGHLVEAEYRARYLYAPTAEGAA